MSFPDSFDLLAQKYKRYRSASERVIRRRKATASAGAQHQILDALCHLALKTTIG
jgi:hypothetical protein